MKYYAVVDTNVVVSALLKEHSLPSRILDLIVEEEIIPIYNDEIIAEYEEVLTRNDFGFSKSKVKMILSIFSSFGEKLDPVEIEEKFTDRKDVIFYQIVMSARTIHESYLVTGNSKHFPKKEYVVTPNEMLKIMKDISVVD